MNSEDSNLWLKKLINTKNFDPWLAVSFLYRYPTVGIHEYICKKLKHYNLLIIIPQLVHVFLYHSDSEISKPLYNLLKNSSLKNRKFFLALYFYLKGSIELIDSKKSIFCYFLICDIFKDELRYNNKKILEAQIYYKKRFSKLPGIFKDKKSISNFDGIFLCFLRSVFWVVDLKMFKNIKDYEKIFLQSKNISKINFKSDFRGYAFRSDLIKSSIIFIEYLIDISKRLNKLPKSLRQKGLEMELKLLNCNLPGRITLPFFKMKYLLNIKIEKCTILNSAENCPFVIVMEVANEKSKKNKMDIKNASFIMKQLNAVSGMTYISESSGIKENVLVSLEQILDIDQKYEESEANLDDVEANLKDYSNIRDDTKDNIKDGLDNIKDGLDNIDGLDILNMNLLNLNGTNDIVDMSSVFFMNKKEENKNEENKDKEIPEEHKNEDNPEENIKIDDKSNPYVKLKDYKMVSMIVKTGSSLKQEIIAYQILSVMQEIWTEEKKDIWIKVYQIYFVNNNAGLVETVTDAYSIHKIKEIGKQENRNFSLKTYFIDKYGDQTEEYKKATHNFLISLVGYSLACYLLQVKDRHNGNILLDSQGHLIHVDFGFILGDHPGFYCVEIAPFKFSSEYEELIRDLSEDFKILFLEGFCALRRHSERLCRILEILSENSDMKCINKKTLSNFKDRLKLEMSDKEIEAYCLLLINKSYNSMGTGLYDSYQYFSNGYL
ncbi:phosphatidylinositol 4-kinase [Vairimorpha necatrix]|uniref:Phosphatidylinositol 4-kinase n=1 Tax=Vairimorpha necatrix TaxID=6039 RepID=A0AAX4JFK8_9MICR